MPTGAAGGSALLRRRRSAGRFRKGPARDGVEHGVFRLDLAAASWRSSESGLRVHPGFEGPSPTTLRSYSVEAGWSQMASSVHASSRSFGRLPSNSGFLEKLSGGGLVEGAKWQRRYRLFCLFASFGSSWAVVLQWVEERSAVDNERGMLANSRINLGCHLVVG